MPMYALGSILQLILAPVALGAIPEHLVTEVPGLESSFPTRQWSGYIPVEGPAGEAIKMHYWLFESTLGMSNAPLVVWHQGGPGGSSMIALFTENGPFQLNDDSYGARYNKTGVPTVFLNPYSWHTRANMLFVEHPAPTGFSYCEDDKCPRWNDTTQGQVNYAFQRAFFDAYPELRSNPFYMTGESYAGVLVPMTALQILAGTNSSNADKAPWSLRGFMLGNACPGNRIFTCTPYSGWIGVRVAVDFRYYHGMISPPTYRRIQEACKDDWERYEAPTNQTCRDLIGPDPARPVMNEAGDTYDMGGGYYLYDHCGEDLLRVGEDGTPITQREGPVGTARQSSGDPATAVYKCGQERASVEWLNLPKVQEAIHVKAQKFQFSTGLDYDFTKHSLLEDYKEVLVKKYNVWQFSGDADPCVPYIGTSTWMESLGYPTASSWRPYSVDSQVAGYTVVYDNGEGSNFTFATVRNAGHMVPRYKPRQALYLFSQFLQNEQL